MEMLEKTEEEIEEKEGKGEGGDSGAMFRLKLEEAMAMP